MTTDRRMLLKTFATAAALSPVIVAAGGAAARPAGAAQLDIDGLPTATAASRDRAAILLLPGFSALDLARTHHLVAGILGGTVHLVTTGTPHAAVRSDLGLPVQPTTTLEDCPDHLDLIVLPGHAGAAIDGRTRAWIAARAATTGHLAGLGNGAALLADAGLTPAAGHAVLTADTSANGDVHRAMLTALRGPDGVTALAEGHRQA